MEHQSEYRFLHSVKSVARIWLNHWGKKVEEAKVAVRNVRRDAQDKMRTLEKNKEISQDESKRAQDDLQKRTNAHISDIDKYWENKVDEMLKI
jgi:ribosome recycling factor